MWTPDSSSLLVVRNDPNAGTRSLWRLSLDAGVAEPLGLAMEGLSDVRLHPDGQRVMFAAGLEGDYQLWAMQDFLR